VSDKTKPKRAKRTKKSKDEKPLDMTVTIIPGSRTPEWDALWRWLLRPLPGESPSEDDQQAAF